MTLTYLYWNHSSRCAQIEFKKNVYAIFSDEFMTNSILDSIGMSDTFIFYDHYHLKMNLEKSLLKKWNVLKPFIDAMFVAKSEITLIALHKQACSICKESNSCVLVLLKLMEKKTLGTLFNR